jgi:hypothetical protein
MTPLRECLDRRLRVWREKLTLVNEVFETLEPSTKPMVSIAPFLYRERFACTCVIDELERLAAELDAR